MIYTIIIPVITGVGAVAFATAAVYGYKNHAMTKDASNIWLYFATSAIMGTIYATARCLEQFIAIPTLIEPTLYFAVIFLFTLVAMGSLMDFIKLQS